MTKMLRCTVCGTIFQAGVNIRKNKEHVLKKMTKKLRCTVCGAIFQAGVNAGVRNTQGRWQKAARGEKLYCSRINLATTTATTK